ncbi:MAG: ABC transporter ATP-binding protein [Bacteroidales bacterium]|nr:ABC transporter ATP-binding protein [Bacteroidales bacterium]
MLKIYNISKSFTQRGLVLNNLCLDVSEGESIAIMGPSGSGKTTLINIIGLLDKPDSGEITFRGAFIANFTDDESAVYRNRNIGFVFQYHLLLPHLTVSENVLLPLLAANYSSDELALKEQHVIELMEKTGISDLADKYPFRISGGEAQRVALVRALANNPSILLADEPTGSLDAKNADILGELLLEMNREFGITLILATHSSDLAKKMTRILQLGEGKLIDLTHPPSGRGDEFRKCILE